MNSYLSARAQNLLDHKEKTVGSMNIQPSSSFTHKPSELFFKCEWKSMMASNSMEKGVVVCLPFLSWAPASANCSQSEKLGLKWTVLEPYSGSTWDLLSLPRFPWAATSNIPLHGMPLRGSMFAILAESLNDNGAWVDTHIPRCSILCPLRRYTDIWNECFIEFGGNFPQVCLVHTLRPVRM